MIIEFIQFYKYFVIGFASLIVNVPCGYIREGYPKFSMKWLLWIHASIPLLIYLRIILGTSGFYVPTCILLAVIGQVIGGQYRRNKMSSEEQLVMKQLDQNGMPIRLKVQADEVVVALLNMGGPKTNRDVRDFQRHLFRDPLLIRFPLSFIFQNIFAWMLIKFRIKETEERYQLIGGGSPIYKSTAAQIKALKQELKQRGYDVDILLSFNYSSPFPHDTIEYLKKRAKKYLLPISLYPHFSKATTGSNLHYLKKARDERYPQLKILESKPYYLHDGYVRSFVDRIKESITSGESLDDFYLIFSAHGLPLYFLTEGDPYPFQISQTVAQILGKLKRNENWAISYQSAVGPMQWLKPSTEDMIKHLAGKGIKNIIIVPVSFVGDHIETICEIDMEYRAEAEKLGITDFRMSKAIETHPGFINALADTIESVLKQPKIESVNRKEYIHVHH